MKPSELDTLVVEAVFREPLRHGWRTIGDIGAYDECEDCGTTAREGRGPEFGCVPAFSLDINAAWDVVEWMMTKTCDFSLEKAGEAWYATCPLGSGGGETAPLAICRAALDVAKKFNEA